MPSTPRSSTSRARERSRPSTVPKVTRPPGEAARRAPSRAGRRRCRRARVAAVGALEDLGLGVGNRVGRREEAEVRVADVRPHADVRLGNRDQRADLPCVIHPQFHHRHVGPRRAAASATAAGRCGCSDSPCSSPRGSASASNSAIASFVVVLPALPVIAITRVPAAIRTACARSCSACSVSPTSIDRRRPASRSTPARRSRARQSPRPPRAEHLGRRSRARRTAVRAAPRTGRRPQRPAVGHDLADSRAPGSPDRSVPPTACATHPRVSPKLVHPDPRLQPPRLQRLPRHRHVVERQRPSADLLVLLVALAGDRARRRPAPRRATACRIASRRSTTVSDVGVALARLRRRRRASLPR